MNPPTSETSEVQDYFADYEERRRTHVRNYAIYMGLIFGLGIVVLLLGVISVTESFMNGQRAGAAVRGFDDMMARGRRPVLPPEPPKWLRPAQAGLGALALGMGGFLLICKRVLPIPLRCPRCEVRVDEIGLIDGLCPKCQIRLK
jgi:hypothetical protein